jgi:serine/threonine protein kinase
LLHGPGTPFYASPEQLNNEKHLIDWRSDQFSIGVIAGHLLTDRHPYQTDPTDPRTAVQAAMDKKGPTAEFKNQIAALGLSPLSKMVAPWPVQRFLHPADVLTALTT